MVADSLGRAGDLSVLWSRECPVARRLTSATPTVNGSISAMSNRLFMTCLATILALAACQTARADALPSLSADFGQTSAPLSPPLFRAIPAWNFVPDKIHLALGESVWVTATHTNRGDKPEMVFDSNRKAMWFDFNVTAVDDDGVLVPNQIVGDVVDWVESGKTLLLGRINYPTTLSGLTGSSLTDQEHMSLHAPANSYPDRRDSG